MKTYLIKYKEILLYILFGALTTGLNLAVYYVLCAIFGDETYMLANGIAWVAGVIFAYVTNKLFVFESKSWKSSTALREAAEFVAARLFSLGVEELGLWILIRHCGFDVMILRILSFEITGPKIAKLILAIVVIILNYIFSKLLIFKKKA